MLCLVTDWWWVVCSSCGMHLADLNLGGTRISDLAAATMGSQCNALQRLDVSFCSRLTDEAIRSICDGCKRLQSIGMAGARCAGCPC